MLSYSKVSNWITDQIYDTVPSARTKNREEVEYGAYMALSEISKISLILIVAGILGVFWYVAGIILLFGCLRFNLGGIHAKTHWACMISYFAFIYGTLALSFFLTNDRLILDATVIPFSFIVSFKYAPADMLCKPIASKKQRKRLRITGFFMLSVLFILAQFTGQVWFNIIMIICALTCVLMTPPIYRLTNNKYSREEVSV